MTMDWTVILGALITAFSVITVSLIQFGRRENMRDHNIVLQELRELGQKVDGHLGWHGLSKKKKK